MEESFCAFDRFNCRFSLLRIYYLKYPFLQARRGISAFSSFINIYKTRKNEKNATCIKNLQKKLNTANCE